MDMVPEPFRIELADGTLTDLRNRLRNTRWPDDAPGEPWSQGTDLSYLRRLIARWADEFDWRAQERRLNAYPQFMVTLDGSRLHFVHVRGGGNPLILAHGWPSSFVEMLPVVDRLSKEFDLIVPSLPGYAFSERPHRVGVDAASTARSWLRLMTCLGYENFGVVGGDFGAAIATHLALQDPARVDGILLTTPEMAPTIDDTSPPLTRAERDYVAELERWDATERGYSAIQSTRPQTLGSALADSPAGLAAWLIEKWRSWSDSGGDVDAIFGTDFLLTLLTIYWSTNSITSSMRDYFDGRLATELSSSDYVTVPTAISLFAHEFVSEGTPPREWYERLYCITQWRVADRGGHFAAAEVPDVLAQHVREHFLHGAGRRR